MPNLPKQSNEVPTSPLDDIKGLDAARWQRARQTAEDLVRKSAKEPDRATFLRAKIQKLPTWMTVSMLVALAIIAGAAFWISAGKQIAATDLVLTPVVRDYKRLSIQWADIGIPLSLLLGELGTILFSLAASVFPGNSVKLRGIAVQPVALTFRCAALLCASFAILANITISAQHQGDMASIAAFGWFLTLAPPVAVLFVGLFLERLLISSLEARTAGLDAYLQAYNAWLSVQVDPHIHPDFQRIWYAQIIDQLMKVSAANRKKIEEAPHLRADLVRREFERHEWTNFVVEGPRPTMPLETGATFSSPNATSTRSSSES